MRVFLGITGASGAPYAARLVESLAAVTPKWGAVEQIDSGPDGVIPRLNVSVKITAADAYDLVGRAVGAVR